MEKFCRASGVVTAGETTLFLRDLDSVPDSSVMAAITSLGMPALLCTSRCGVSAHYSTSCCWTRAAVWLHALVTAARVQQPARVGMPAHARPCCMLYKVDSSPTGLQQGYTPTGGTALLLVPGTASCPSSTMLQLSAALSEAGAALPSREQAPAQIS